MEQKEQNIQFNWEFLENLGENIIYFISLAKKLRADYHKQVYEMKIKNENKNQETWINNENGDNKNFTNNNIKEIIEKPIIFVTYKKMLSATKLSQTIFDKIWVIALEQKLIQQNEKKKISINIDIINKFFEEVDVKTIETKFLETAKNIESTKIIKDAADMTFNDKVQKIFSNIEILNDKIQTIKELITEKLEENETYVNLINEKQQIEDDLKIKREEILSKTTLIDVKTELDKELKEEKWILKEFLEFWLERGELNKLNIFNKEGKIMKPQISINLRQEKTKK